MHKFDNYCNISVKSQTDSDRLRSYSNILTNSTFNNLVRNHNKSYLLSTINKYDKELLIGNHLTYKDYFSYIYSVLKSHYRSEYIYKNYLITKMLSTESFSSDFTILNEFKINKSIADLVLINGTTRVLEIKTALDDSRRLSSQINDYKKAFKEICIVTHFSLADKYLKITDKSIGIIAINDNSLDTIREPMENNSFDNTVIIKCLRKAEYTQIIYNYFGYLPESTDFNFFRECVKMFQKIPSEKLHDMMVQELKKRIVRERMVFLSQEVPDEIKHICFCLNFKKNEYQVLNKILAEKL